MACSKQFDYTENIQQILGGSEEAFNRLYMQSIGLVESACRKYLKDKTLTDDMVLDVYVQVRSSLSQLRDPEKFNGWVTTIARNRCFRENQRNETAERERRTTPIPDLHDDNVAEDRILFQTARDETADLENDELLRQIMADLSERERRCIYLYFMENYKDREIAEMLNIPLGTVKSSKHYAMKKMRRKADDIEEKEGIALHGFSFPALIHARRLYQSLRDPSIAASAAVSAPAPIAAAHTAGVSFWWKLLAIMLTIGVAAGGIGYGISYSREQRPWTSNVVVSTTTNSTAVRAAATANPRKTASVSIQQRNISVTSVRQPFPAGLVVTNKDDPPGQTSDTESSQILSSTTDQDIPYN